MSRRFHQAYASAVKDNPDMIALGADKKTLAAFVLASADELRQIAMQPMSPSLPAPDEAPSVIGPTTQLNAVDVAAVAVEPDLWASTPAPSMPVEVYAAQVPVVDPPLASTLSVVAKTALEQINQSPYKSRIFFGAQRSGKSMLVAIASKQLAGRGVKVYHLNLLSYARIVGLDPDPAKRARAIELGADIALDSSDANFSEAAVEHDLAGACSAVLDFVGTDASLTTARSLLAARGMLNIIGLGGGSTELSFFTMPPESVVTTTNWGSAPEMREVIALAGDGRIESTVTTYSLEDAQQAVNDLRAGRVDGRAVIVP
jgi:hypothetical protein